MSNYLVTGGAGFIGGHVQDALTNNKCVVVDPKKNEYSPKYYHRMRIQDDYPMSMIMGAEYINRIIHLGAVSNIRESMLTPANLYENNVKATAVLLEQVLKLNNPQQIESIVFASSSACLEPRESHYGISKFTCEEMLSVFQEQTGIPCIALRFGNVIGERQNPKNGTVVPTWIERYLAGEKCQIYGDGTQLRDYVYVKDVVDCILYASDPRNNIKGVHNVSTGKLHTVNEVKQIFIDILGFDISFEYVEAKQGDKQIVVLPPDEQLPACNVGIKESIKRAINWRRENPRPI